MKPRRWRFSRFVALSIFAAALLGTTGCQSDTEAVQDHGEVASSRRQPSVDSPEAGVAPQLGTMAGYDVLYATVDGDLEPGYQLLFDGDLRDAVTHFSALDAKGAEWRLSRDIGLGRAYLVLGVWMRQCAELTAELDQGYLSILEASVKKGFSKPLEEKERFVAARAAAYLGQWEKAGRYLEKVGLPGVSFWKSLVAAKGRKETANLENWLDKQNADGAWAALLSGNAEVAKVFLTVAGAPGIYARLRGQAPKLAFEVMTRLNWRQATDGRFWDPYVMDLFSRVFLLAARSNFEQALKVAQDARAAVDPSIDQAIRLLLARSCRALEDSPCVAGLGSPSRDSLLGLMIIDAKNKLKGEPTTLEQLHGSDSSLQMAMLRASLANGSPMDAREKEILGGIEWGEKNLASANPPLWVLVFQQAATVAADLSLRQAMAMKKPEQRAAKLTEGIATLSQAQIELEASRDEPLFLLQQVRLLWNRSACSDLALAKSKMHEKQELHPELTPAIKMLGSFTLYHCNDVDPPLNN